MRNLNEYKLDFIPEHYHIKECDVNGDRVKVGLAYTNGYDKTGHKLDWALFNDDVLEISSDSAEDYNALFLDQIGFLRNERILIIGGGDFVLANEIKSFAPYTNVTIVDPLVYDIKGMYDFLFERYIMINNSAIEKCNLLNNTFDGQVFIGKYDIVLCDVSDDHMKATKEIYCKNFFKRVSSLLEDDGIFLMYDGTSNVMDYDTDYFDRVGSKSNFIPAFNEVSTVIKYRKKKDVNNSGSDEVAEIKKSC